MILSVINMRKAGITADNFSASRRPVSNNHLKSKISMEDQKYVCDVCDWVYDPAKGDPDNGIAPGTAFADLPDDWVCPLCGVGKDEFSPID